MNRRGRQAASGFCGAHAAPAFEKETGEGASRGADRGDRHWRSGASAGPPPPANNLPTFKKCWGRGASTYAAPPMPGLKATRLGAPRVAGRGKPFKLLNASRLPRATHSTAAILVAAQGHESVQCCSAARAKCELRAFPSGNAVDVSAERRQGVCRTLFAVLLPLFADLRRFERFGSRGQTGALEVVTDLGLSVHRDFRELVVL